MRYSGPYEIKDISKSGNCLLEHVNGGTKKQKIPLAHLQRCHDRTLEVESDNGNMDESECNGRRITVIKDRSLYPTHDPPLYSEQQYCMLQFNEL